MPPMRINLVSLFAEKVAVKELGARWDVVKKVWYIVDVSDLTSFMRWIPDLEKATNAVDVPTSQKALLKQPVAESQGVITPPTVAMAISICQYKYEPEGLCSRGFLLGGLIGLRLQV